MTDSGREPTRHQLSERLEGLRGRDLTDEQVAAEVRHFLAAGEPAIPILLQQFADEDEALLAVATQTLKAWEGARPVQPLIAMLRDRAVGDLSKALILSILEAYGLDVNDPKFLGLSINLEEYKPGIGKGGDGDMEGG